MSRAPPPMPPPIPTAASATTPVAVAAAAAGAAGGGPRLPPALPSTRPPPWPSARRRSSSPPHQHQTAAADAGVGSITMPAATPANAAPPLPPMPSQPSHSLQDPQQQHQQQRSPLHAIIGGAPQFRLPPPPAGRAGVVSPAPTVAASSSSHFAAVSSSDSDGGASSVSPPPPQIPPPLPPAPTAMLPPPIPTSASSPLNVSPRPALSALALTPASRSSNEHLLLSVSTDGHGDREPSPPPFSSSLSSPSSSSFSLTMPEPPTPFRSSGAWTPETAEEEPLSARSVTASTASASTPASHQHQRNTSFVPLQVTMGMAPQFRLPAMVGGFSSVRQARLQAEAEAARVASAEETASAAAAAGPPPLPATAASPTNSSQPPSLPAAAAAATSASTPPSFAAVSPSSAAAVTAGRGGLSPPPLPSPPQARSVSPQAAVPRSPGGTGPPPLPSAACVSAPDHRPTKPMGPPPLPGTTHPSDTSVSGAATMPTLPGSSALARFDLAAELATLRLDALSSGGSSGSGGDGEESREALEADLARRGEELRSTRARMICISRSNFILERELIDVDEKIKLLIKNRITVAEVMLSSAPGTLAGGAGGGAHEQHDVLPKRRLYEELFLLLQSKPRYLALLARLIQPKGEAIPLFVQSVCFDIYGDSFGSHEERLLLSLFKQVLRAEMDACAPADRATLLRSNSAITQMLSAYARRGQGLGILRDILEDPLRTLCESAEWKSRSLELQPLKVLQGLIVDFETEHGSIATAHGLDKNIATDEAAAEVPAVQKALAERTAHLVEACDMILQRILSAVEAIPYGMRWICRTIGTLFLERFGGEEVEEDGEETAGKTPQSNGHTNGNNTSTAAAADGSIAGNGGDSNALPPPSSSSLHRQVQSLQGGYVYLRFLNPAIVAPDGMNLIKAKPSKTVRRNLVLVAKVLQNLSNGVLFGGKEKYMQALNTFIESKRPAMERFFAALCAVEDVDEALSIERYTHSNLTSLSGSGSGSSSGSGTITIQLNQIYAMHQLLLQHKEQICLTRHQPAIHTANDPLAILLTKLGPNVPAPVPRAENASATLRLEQTRSTRLSTVSGPPPPGGSSGGASSELVVHDPFGRGGACASATEANPLYQQAKALLLSVLSRLPTDEAGSSSLSPEKLHAHSLLGFLTAHKSAALLQGNEALSDSLANVISMLNTLFSMKLLSSPSSSSGAPEAREAAFNAFLHAAAQEALARQKEQAWLAKQSALVTAALHTVTKHHDYLQGRLDVYRTYLQNVRQGQAQQAAASAGGKGGAKGLSSSSSSSKSSAAASAAAAPAFSKTLKYSHADLLSMQLLASVDAEIPAKVLKALQYSIEMVVPATATPSGIGGIGAATTKATPRFFLSVVLKKGLTIPLLASPVEIVLEDLLALQEHATPTMTVESVQLNVNILVHLLNTQFIAAIPKR